MSVLEDYEKRCDLKPLESVEVLDVVEECERRLIRARRPPEDGDYNRLVVWLHDRLQTLASSIEKAKDVPMLHRCGWCGRAAGLTRQTWDSLPAMSLDDIQAHAQICEHNPLVQRVRYLDRERDGFRTEGVLWRRWADRYLGGRGAPDIELRKLLDDKLQRVRELEAKNEDLRGRALGIDDNLRDAIRSLLKSEMTAGELRRALGELIR